jgi:hypothetical protein
MGRRVKPHPSNPILPPRKHQSPKTPVSWHQTRRNSQFRISTPALISAPKHPATSRLDDLTWERFPVLCFLFPDLRGQVLLCLYSVMMTNVVVAGKGLTLLADSPPMRLASGPRRSTTRRAWKVGKVFDKAFTDRSLHRDHPGGADRLGFWLDVAIIFKSKS